MKNEALDMLVWDASWCLRKEWEAGGNKCLVVKNGALIRNLGSVIIYMVFLKP